MPFRTLPGWSVFTILAMYALAYASHHLTVPDNYSPIIWLPAGLSLALTIWHRHTLLPAIFIGALLANTHHFLFRFDVSLIQAIMLVFTLSLVQTVQPYFIVRLAQTLGTPPYPLRDPNNLLISFTATLIILLFSSGVHSGIYWLANLTNDTTTLKIFTVTLLADTAGILLITPLMLTHINSHRFDHIRANIIDWSLWFGMLITMTLISIHNNTQSLYFVLPLLIWAATRFGQAGTTLASLICALLSMVNFVTITPDNMVGRELNNILLLELLLITMLLTTLYISALLESRLHIESQLEETVFQRTLALEAANQELKDEVYVRKQAEKSFRTSSRRYRALIETAGSPIIVMDKQFIIKQWNGAAEQLFGYAREEIIGKNYIDCFVPKEYQDETAWKITKVLESGVSRESLESEALSFDSTIHFMLWNINRLADAEEELNQVIIIGQDITEIRVTQDQLHYLAHYDTLTGSANRRLFEDRCIQAIKHATRYKQQVALITLDIDHFKRINDTLGHDAGDELLREICERIKGCIRREDTLARLGGDEFAILLAEVNGIEGAEKVSRNILSRMTQPIQVPGGELVITSSIGITIAPTDGTRYPDLLKNADMAMYRAKNAGRNNVQFYSPEMNEEMQRQLALEKDLRTALQKNQFRNFYQPIVDLETGEIIGLETLLRWEHPVHGLLRPDQFIKVAEQTGQLAAIGEWVIKNACLQGRAILQMSPKPVQISVNLSARQYSHPRLISLLETALSETHFDPKHLILEIAENTITNKLDESRSTLQALKALGIQLAIDSFGTGISSLSQIKLLPIDIIKIDRSFVAGLPHDEHDVTITETLLTISRQMNLQAFAAGIENADQEAFMRINGCRFGQGHYYAKPMSGEAIAKLFQQWRQQTESDPNSSITLPLSRQI